MREATPLDAAASLGLALDLVDPAAYEHAVQRCRELRVALPTFAQLADPVTLPAEAKATLSLVDPQAPDARNLFRVHWHNSLDGSMVSVPDHIELPAALTGVEARMCSRSAIGSR